MQLMDTIKQRHTVKTFESHSQIDRKTIEEMISLAGLAPSKANLQPWRFVVLDNEQSKAKITELMAFNTTPTETSAAMILVLADVQCHLLVETIIDQAITAGFSSKESKNDTLQFLQHHIDSLTPQELREQALIDGSLAAMQFMLIAKDQGYDTHPIGIFDKSQVLKNLAINAERYVPVMFIALGKGAVPAKPTCRLPLEKILFWDNGEQLPNT